MIEIGAKSKWTLIYSRFASVWSMSAEKRRICMYNAYWGDGMYTIQQDDKMLSIHDRAISSEIIRVWRRQVLTSECTAVNDCNFVSMNDFVIIHSSLYAYKRKHMPNGVTQFGWFYAIRICLSLWRRHNFLFIYDIRYSSFAANWHMCLICTILFKFNLIFPFMYL